MLLEKAVKVLDLIWPTYHWYPQFVPFDVVTLDNERVRGWIMSAYDTGTKTIVHRKMTASELRRRPRLH
jgi:hypothetical protein